MKRILLVGAGHAHAYLLASLAKEPLYGARLTLVSPSARQIYSAMLPGVIAGHYRRDFLPISLPGIASEFGNALRGRLSHQVGVYNALQRAAYLGIIVVGIVLVLSGLAIWKPVQFQEIGALMGGYEGARLVHFIAMAAIVLFVVVHVVMVLLVPRTFLPMFTGWARKDH